MSAEDGSGSEALRPFRAKPKEPLLERAVPVSGDLAHYRVPRARRDGVAALTVAALRPVGV